MITLKNSKGENMDVYCTNELEGLYNDVWGFDTWDNVKQRLLTQTSPTSFADYSQTMPTLKADKFGCVPLIGFIQGDWGDLSDPGESVDLDEIEEAVQKWDYDTDEPCEPSETWYATSSDNTFNYGGFLEREIQFDIWENLENDYVLVMAAVHVGLDVRAGYTSSFPLLFENRYQVDEWLVASDCLGWFTCTSDTGRVIELEAIGSACFDMVQVYIQSDSEGELEGRDYEIYLDLFDKDTACESVAQFLADELDLQGWEVVAQ